MLRMNAGSIELSSVKFRVVNECLRFEDALRAALVTERLRSRQPSSPLDITAAG